MSADGRALPTTALRFERSARLWMRAYPRRWRAQRGEELLGLLLDLADPDARRLGARAASDLVLGGWATRWRLRPPVHTWLLYRAFDRRIPAGYRAWAQDDIEGFLFPLRRYVDTAGWVCALILVQESMAGAGWWLLVGAALSMVIQPDYFRRRHLLKHVAPQVGEPVAEGNLVTQPVPRRRVAARAYLMWCVTTGALLLVAGVATTVLAPVGMWVVPTVPEDSVGFGTYTNVGPIVDRAPLFAVVALGLLIGLGCARIAHRRLLRWLDVPADQPYRVVVPRLALSDVAGLVVACAVVLAWMSLEIRVGLPLFAGLSVSVLSAMLLPGALVALGMVSRTASTRDVPGSAPAATASTRGVTGSDVRSILVHNRLPAADVPSPALRPLVGPVPQGAVMVRAGLGEPLSVALPDPPPVALP